MCARGSWRKVDDEYACSSQCASDDVFPIEGFPQAEATGDCSYDGNQGIVDGHLAHGVAGEELVVQGKSYGADAYEEDEVEDATG